MLPSEKAVVIIPTYNESENLPPLIAAIEGQNLGLDILFVDDNSPDGTGQLAENLSKQNPHIKVLRRKIKNGLGRAYVEGFLWAIEHKYSFILQMDADLSHDPQALPVFLEKIKTHDAVFGSRYLDGVRVENWSFSRLLLSKVSNEFIRWVLRIPSTDTTTAYKCFRREVLEILDPRKLKGFRNDFLIELVFETYVSGFRTLEIPFMFRERISGESKMEVKVAGAALMMVFKCFFRKLFYQMSGRKMRAVP